MTITITRTTEFSRQVSEDEPDFDLALAVDCARLEANHCSIVTHEEIQILGTAVKQCSLSTTE